MAARQSTGTNEIQDIQRRMAQIRLDLHADVRETVQGAQSLTDWRSVVKSRPWLCVGVALASGYLLVPKRRPERPAIVTVAGLAPGQSLAAPAMVPSRSAGRATFGIALSLVAPILVRAAQSYAAQHLETWLANHPFPPVGPRPQGPSGDEGARPAGPTFHTPRFRDPGRAD
jgi:hypothetical protein